MQPTSAIIPASLTAACAANSPDNLHHKVALGKFTTKCIAERVYLPQVISVAGDLTWGIATLICHALFAEAVCGSLGVENRMYRKSCANHADVHKVLGSGQRAPAAAGPAAHRPVSASAISHGSALAGTATREPVGGLKVARGVK